MRRSLFLVLMFGLAACSSSKAPTPTGATTSRAPAASIAPSSQAPTPSASSSITASASPTSASPGPKPEPAKSAAPNVPPAAGTYTYEQSGETKAGTITIPVDATGTLQIDPATNVSGGKRQRQFRRYSSNETGESVLVFRNDGVYLESTTATVYGFSQECRTASPILAVELPLRVGATWTDSGTCEGLDLSVSGKVLRTERYTVGGRSVLTYVIRVTGTGTGEQGSQTTTETMWLSPDYRLSVHSTSQATGTSQGMRFTRDVTETLTSLTPK